MSEYWSTAIPCILIHYTNMKINSIITGKGSKRIGNVVMATYGGETIARQYNPSVTNPSTEGQKDTRSRFKLMSQLGSVVSPVLAIRKQGLVSARNKFTSINFPLTSFEQNTAQIALNSVQITDSNRSFVGFNADRSGSSTVVKLDADGSTLYDKVVYCAFRKTDFGDLIHLDDVVVEEPGGGGHFEGTLAKINDAVVIYAYGIKAASERMRVKFNNMQTPSAEKVASLVVASSENYLESQITQTAGLTLNVGETVADSDEHRYGVTRVVVGDVDITNGVPAGTTFAAGSTTATINCVGDLERGCSVQWWDDTDKESAASKQFSSSPVSISANLVAGHLYSLVVRFPESTRYFSNIRIANE